MVGLTRPLLPALKKASVVAPCHCGTRPSNDSDCTIWPMRSAPFSIFSSVVRQVLRLLLAYSMVNGNSSGTGGMAGGPAARGVVAPAHVDFAAQIMAGDLVI